VKIVNPSALYTFPLVLACLPAVIAVLALRVVAGRGGDAERRRRSLVLLVLALAAVGSITYYPDFIHLAFIGPVCVVIVADLLERALEALATRPALERATGAVLATVLLAGTTWQLRAVMARSWREYPLAHDTAFGTLRFRTAHEIVILQELQETLGASRELFIYPWGAGHYLLTGTVNPTPYQWMDPRYSGADQMQKVMDVLEKRRVPHVLIMKFPIQAGDPILDYVATRYKSTGKPLTLLERVDARDTR
jgi:hypothetical protein